MYYILGAVLFVAFVYGLSWIVDKAVNLILYGSTAPRGNDDGNRT